MVCEDKLCGIDSETTLIRNGYEWPDVVIAGFCSGEECQLVMWNDLPVYLPQFLKINPKTKLVFFNLPFDVNVMGRDILLPELDKEDRMMELGVNYRIHLIAKQGWLPGRITLDYITKKTLGVYLNKEDGTRTSFTRESPVTMRQMEYLVEDCAATYHCGKAYDEQPTESIQARASFVLSEISHNGMLVDREALSKTRQEVLDKMDELAPILTSYNFRLKKDTDDMSKVERLIYLAKLLGIEKADFALKDIKLVNDAYIWIMASTIYTVIAEGGALLSKVAEPYRYILELIALGKGKADKKQFKELVDQAKAVLSEALEPIECDTCIVGINGKPGKSGKPALVMLTILIEQFVQGNLMHDMEAFYNEFKFEHEYNLGWLDPGVKPLSPAKFIQKHLRKMMADHPGLQFTLTDGATKAIKKYRRECLSKRIVEDPKVIDELSSYQCKKADMWLLEDLGLTDNFLDVYTDYKHCEKLLSTYLTDKYIEGDGRVHPNFGIFLATGRMSCSAPNIQNLPKEKGLREQYIPATGCVLCSCDYELAVATIKKVNCWKVSKENNQQPINQYLSLYDMNWGKGSETIPQGSRVG